MMVKLSFAAKSATVGLDGCFISDQSLLVIIKYKK